MKDEKKAKRGDTQNLYVFESIYDLVVEAATGQNVRSGAYTDVDDDEPYTFRKGDIRVFDLGTRGDEDGHHRTIEPFIIPVDGDTIGGTYKTNYGAKLLLPDFQSALELPTDSEKLFLDIGFARKLEIVDEVQTYDFWKWIQVGRRDSRPLLQTIVDMDLSPVSPDPYPPNHDDAGELSAGKWSGKSGKLKRSGDYAIAIASAYFQTFNTLDTFTSKVTGAPEDNAEPSMDDPAVEFTVKPGDKLKLYLAPRMAYVGDTGLFDLPLHFFPLQQAPLDYEPSYDLHKIFTDPGSNPPPSASVILTAPQWADLVAYVLSFHPGSSIATDLELNTYWNDSEFGAGTLDAIALKNGEVFYFWRNSGTNGWPFKVVTFFPPL